MLAFKDANGQGKAIAECRRSKSPNRILSKCATGPRHIGCDLPPRKTTRQGALSFGEHTKASAITVESAQSMRVQLIAYPMGRKVAMGRLAAWRPSCETAERTRIAMG